MSLAEWVAVVEARLGRSLTVEEAKAAFQYHKAGLTPDDLLKDLGNPQKPKTYRFEPDGKRIRRI